MRHQPWRRPLLAVVGALVLVLLWAGLAAAMAAKHLQDARQLAGSAESDLSPAALRDVAVHARSAEWWLRHPGPLLASRLPLVGASLRAERSVAESVAVTAGAGASVAELLESQPLVEDGEVHLDRLQRLSAELEAAAAAVRPALDRLASVDARGLPDPLAEAVIQTQDRLADADDSVARAAAMTTVMQDVLGADRPRSVLFVLQNNAELRATGGLVSTFALGRAHEGRLTMEPFQDVHAVADTPEQAVPVAAPPEYVEQYGAFLAGTTLWKNANMAPDATVSNEVLANVARRLLGSPVDVVVALDVPALVAVTSALGEVTLPDGRGVTADALAEELLVTEYADAGPDWQEQPERRRAQRGAADDALRRVVSGQAPPLELARVLGRAAAGRHLTVWSAVEPEQQLLRRAGLAGEVDRRGGDLAMPVVHNLGGPGHLDGGGPGEGNKLDYYVDRSVSVTAVVGTEAADVTQRVSLHNRTPDGLGSYVAGFTAPGRLTELVSLSVSPDAQVRSVSVDGAEVPFERFLTDSSLVLRLPVVIDPGQTVEVAVEYRCDASGGGYALRAVPQPLASPASLRLDVRPASGTRLQHRVGSGWAGARPAA
ncbi:MAG TPA: DUF4012 domain-containing protein, partial [Mycobacteriales bacterium]|nr:DUF4012 domain-containing protein [Mycobacteriales bacterium]